MKTKKRPGAAIKKDIGYRDEGSIIVFYAYSDVGKQWLEENVQAEPWQYMGPGLCVDHRPAGAILSGACEDGLVVGEI